MGGLTSSVSAQGLAKALYNKDAEELTSEEKSVVTTPVTALASAGGSVASGDTRGMVSAGNAARVEVENNSLGAMSGSGLGFWLGKTPDCDTACKANIAKGVAKGNLVVSAGVAGVAGGAMIVGATPEIVAIAKTALEGCKSAPLVCLNNTGLQVAKAVTPGGVGAAGVIGVGKTAVEATAAKEEAVAANAANAAKNTGKNIEGSLSGQPTKLPPNASAENIRSLQRENEGAAILSQNGYHVEQNPVTPGVKNPDYKINGEVFDNIAPKTNSVRNIYDRALEKVNSGQTNNVVINLADTKASVSDLQKQFSDWPIKGLDKVIVIDQSGKPIRIK
ncbi:VENN motif pre-toxin domain-containing protein [Mangrovibacter sp. SLW1]